MTKVAIACAVVAACKTSGQTVELDASAPLPTASPTASASVVPDDAPSASTSASPVMPSVAARAVQATTLPTSINAMPATWRACVSDQDCVAIPSACCGSWPSNVVSRDRVQHAVVAADLARDNCRNRVCARIVERPACEHGQCNLR